MHGTSSAQELELKLKQANDLLQQIYAELAVLEFKDAMAKIKDMKMMLMLQCDLITELDEVLAIKQALK